MEVKWVTQGSVVATGPLGVVATSDKEVGYPTEAGCSTDVPTLSRKKKREKNFADLVLTRQKLSFRCTRTKASNILSRPNTEFKWDTQYTI